MVGIPGIKCNLINIGQLSEKGYNIHMKNNKLCVMDVKGVLILKALMVAKRTFKVKMKVIEHMCLAGREEWILNYRLRT